MPPHEGAGDSIDWREAESSYRTVFPRDYKEFVATYGRGEVDMFLTFLVPGKCEGPRPSDSMAEETAEARRMWLRRPPAGYGTTDPALVVAWGVTSRADLLCWAPGGEQGPDEWPVAVWSRGSLNWTVHDCGMLEYVVRLLRGELDSIPAEADRVHRFVHVREARRLLAAGINPDTGEPDPDAGMFGPPPPWLSQGS
jgi:hypothetical protein